MQYRVPVKRALALRLLDRGGVRSLGCSGTRGDSMRARGPNASFGTGLLTGLLAGLLLGLLLAFFAWPRLSALLLPGPRAVSSRPGLEEDAAFIRLAERVTRAVVNIRT